MNGLEDSLLSEKNKKKCKHMVETIIQEEDTTATDPFGRMEEHLATEECPANEDEISFHSEDGLYYAYLTEFTHPRSSNKVHNACCDLLRRCKRSCKRSCIVTMVVVWAIIALLCIVPVSVILISTVVVDKNQSNGLIEPPALS